MTVKGQRVTPAQFGTAYWAVVSGAESFPDLEGCQRGVRVDEALGSSWLGGRVWTTREAAERHLRALELVESAKAAAGLSHLDLLQFLEHYRVQAIVRPEGAMPTVWFPADEANA